MDGHASILAAQYARINQSSPERPGSVTANAVVSLVLQPQSGHEDRRALADFPGSIPRLVLEIIAVDMVASRTSQDAVAPDVSSASMNSPGDRFCLAFERKSPALGHQRPTP
jgi:hypothetical protein